MRTTRSKRARLPLFQVIVRNNITGQSFRFTCGRSFGRGVDDGATERVLVAELVRPRTSATNNEGASPVHAPPPLSKLTKLMSTSMMLNQLSGGGGGGHASSAATTQSRPQSPAGGALNDDGGGAPRRPSMQQSRAQLAHQTSDAPRRSRYPSVEPATSAPQYNYYSARSASISRNGGASTRSASITRGDAQLAPPPLSAGEVRVNELQHRIG